MGTQPTQPSSGSEAAVTQPADLHIPEELPPPMPELADTPAAPAEVLQPCLCPLPRTDSTRAPAEAAQAETRPADLHIPEELPPPMPELADRPKRS